MRVHSSPSLNITYIILYFKCCSRFRKKYCFFFSIWFRNLYGVEISKCGHFLHTRRWVLHRFCLHRTKLRQRMWAEGGLCASKECAYYLHTLLIGSRMWSTNLYFWRQDHSFFWFSKCGVGKVEKGRRTFIGKYTNYREKRRSSVIKELKIRISPILQTGLKVYIMILETKQDCF